METKELLEKKVSEEYADVENSSHSKKTSFIKMKNRTKFRILIILSVLIIGILIGFKLGKGNPEKEPPKLPDSIINPEHDIDVTYLNTALKEASELTTAKLKINGLVNFKDKGIIILNKSDFTMKYTADISAGIDMSKVEIKKDDVDHENKKIIVKIPKAKVFKPNVYHGPKYIEFYDEHFALFNVNEKEDLSRALAMAEKEAKKEAVKNGLLELANKQSETLIKGILSDTVSPTGYTIEIKYLDTKK